MKTLSGIFKVFRGLTESKQRWRLLDFVFYSGLARLVIGVNLGVTGFKGISIIVWGFLEGLEILPWRERKQRLYIDALCNPNPKILGIEEHSKRLEKS